MIEWKCDDVAEFLEIVPRLGEVSNPLGVFPTYTFDLPCPLGTVHFVVWPTAELCMFNDESQFVSASVQTQRIRVDWSPDGQCVVLVGKGGHACIVAAKPYYHLEFSMYGDKPNHPWDDQPPTR